ncbi:MAG: SufD family Fe-S cluster assembly protein [Veillonellaceae bacterium]|nr:SufD family Fe-S cluster assembly protein [Veillonellaceae bacterium]
MDNNTLLFNELPRPTFRWLGMNHTEDSIQEGMEAAKITVYADEGVVSPLKTNDLMKADYEGANKTALEEVAKHYTAGFHILVPEGQTEKVEIVFDVQTMSLGDKTRVFIEAEKGASLELLYVLKGTANKGHLNLLTEVNAQDNAKVSIKKVQLLGESIQQIEHRYTKLADKSQVTYMSLELGGNDNILNYQEDLDGADCNFVQDIAYMGDKEQKFDISALMTHRGKRSNCDLHALGALNGHSKKTFRGTIDFLRGCSAAEGAEEDTCMLLTPNVHSNSLPLLLCKEDNVVGNHAASAGQLDKSKLFYLMSRGFSENEAKHIIVESMLRPLIDRIGKEDLEEEALAAVRAKI